jgi:hypothetical protein
VLYGKPQTANRGSRLAVWRPSRKSKGLYCQRNNVLVVYRCIRSNKNRPQIFKQERKTYMYMAVWTLVIHYVRNIITWNFRYGCNCSHFLNKSLHKWNNGAMEAINMTETFERHRISCHTSMHKGLMPSQ